AHRAPTPSGIVASTPGTCSPSRRATDSRPRVTSLDSCRNAALAAFGFSAPIRTKDEQRSRFSGDQVNVSEAVVGTGSAAIAVSRRDAPGRPARGQLRTHPVAWDVPSQVQPRQVSAVRLLRTDCGM